MTKLTNLEACGLDAALKVIAGKWKATIIWRLYEHQTIRFGALRRTLPGISEKILAEQLRQLEEDGVVLRRQFDEMPLRVEYALTPHGLELNDAVHALAGWGTRHFGRSRPCPVGEDVTEGLSALA